MRPVNNCSSDKGIYVIRPLSCNFLSLSCTNKTSKKINYHHTEMWMKCRLMTLSLISNPAQVKTQTQNKCHSELPIQNQNRNSMEKNDYTSSIQKLWNDCYLPLAPFRLSAMTKHLVPTDMNSLVTQVKSKEILTIPDSQGKSSQLGLVNSLWDLMKMGRGALVNWLITVRRATD